MSPTLTHDELLTMLSDAGSLAIMIEAMADLMADDLDNPAHVRGCALRMATLARGITNTTGHLGDQVTPAGLVVRQ